MSIRTLNSGLHNGSHVGYRIRQISTRVGHDTEQNRTYMYFAKKLRNDEVEHYEKWKCLIRKVNFCFMVSYPFVFDPYLVNATGNLPLLFRCLCYFVMVASKLNHMAALISLQHLNACRPHVKIFWKDCHKINARRFPVLLGSPGLIIFLRVAISFSFSFQF